MNLIRALVPWLLLLLVSAAAHPSDPSGDTGDACEARSGDGAGSADGDGDDTEESASERKKREVELTEAFLASRPEVSDRLWERFMSRMYKWLPIALLNELGRTEPVLHVEYQGQIYRCDYQVLDVGDESLDESTEPPPPRRVRRRL